MPQSGLAVSWLDEGNDEAPESRTVLRDAGYLSRAASTGAGLGTRGADAGGHAEAGTGPGAGVPGRRTITITGHGAVDRLHPPPQRRRAGQRPHERPGFRPDRAAMWAVLLCVLMILAAATSSHAATPALGGAHPGAPSSGIAALHGAAAPSLRR